MSVNTLKNEHGGAYTQAAIAANSFAKPSVLIAAKFLLGETGQMASSLLQARNSCESWVASLMIKMAL